MLKDRFMFVYMKQLFREGTEVSKNYLQHNIQDDDNINIYHFPNFQVFLHNFCVLPKCTVAQYATLVMEIL